MLRCILRSDCKNKLISLCCSSCKVKDCWQRCKDDPLKCGLQGTPIVAIPDKSPLRESVPKQAPKEAVPKQPPTTPTPTPSAPKMHYFHCLRPDGTKVVYKRSTLAKTYASEVVSFRKFLAAQDIKIEKEEVI